MSIFSSTGRLIASVSEALEVGPSFLYNGDLSVRSRDRWPRYHEGREALVVQEWSFLNGRLLPVLTQGEKCGSGLRHLSQVQSRRRTVPLALTVYVFVVVVYCVDGLYDAVCCC